MACRWKISLRIISKVLQRHKRPRLNIHRPASAGFFMRRIPDMKITYIPILPGIEICLSLRFSLQQAGIHLKGRRPLSECPKAMQG
jgi:hypothetical protein